MTLQFHGGLPLIDAGVPALHSDCCCQTNCTMPCNPYTTFDVALTVDGDELTWETPPCYLEFLGITRVPEIQPYCWIFPTPPPREFRQFDGTWWVVLGHAVRRVHRRLTGLSGLSFSVNLPLTSTASTGCCRYIPTGSPSDIDGGSKRFALTSLTLVETYTIENWFKRGEFATFTKTSTFDAEVWLGAGCLGSLKGGTGLCGVGGIGKFLLTSSVLSTSDICDCFFSSNFFNVGCVERRYSPIGRDFAGGLAGVQNHPLVEVYPNLLIEAHETDWYFLCRCLNRSGSDCVQGLYTGSFELDRKYMCSGIPWPGPQTQLVRGNAVPFTLTVEAA